MSHITPEKVRAGVVRLSKLPGNNICADCKVANPKWASVNIGIFLCYQCAGIHRELGVHITQVRSLSLDTWKVQWYRTIKHRGNVKANAHWEPALKESDRPTAELGMDIRKKFIRDKYERGMYRRSTGRRAPARRGNQAVRQKAKPVRPVAQPTFTPSPQPKSTPAATSGFSFVDADSGKAEGGEDSGFSFIEADTSITSPSAAEPLFDLTPASSKPPVPPVSVNNGLWLDQMTSGGYPKTKHHVPLNSPYVAASSKQFTGPYASLSTPTNSPDASNRKFAQDDLLDISGLSVGTPSPPRTAATGGDAFSFLDAPASGASMQPSQTGMMGMMPSAPSPMGGSYPPAGGLMPNMGSPAGGLMPNMMPNMGSPAGGLIPNMGSPAGGVTPNMGSPAGGVTPSTTSADPFADLLNF